MPPAQQVRTRKICENRYRSQYKSTIEFTVQNCITDKLYMFNKPSVLTNLVGIGPTYSTVIYSQEDKTSYSSR